MTYSEFEAAQTEFLTKIISTIESEEFDKETVKADINAIVKKQAEYGKNSYTKKASQVTKYQEILNELGYDDTYTNPADFVNKFKEKTTTIENKTNEYQLLEARLKSLEAEKEAETKRANELRTKTDNNTIETKLREALDGQIKGSKYVIKDLISEGKVKLVNNEVVFTNGDEVVLFSDGIKKVFDENSDLVITSIKPGVGSSPKSQSNTRTSLSMESINKMTPEQIKANMSEIRKLAGLR